MASIAASGTLKEETDMKLVKINKFIGSLKADIQVDMNHIKTELGIGDPRMSPKTNMYTISRIVEMIL